MLDEATMISDSPSSRIELKKAARFLTNFIGLFDDNQRRDRLNEIVEKLSGILTDHEGSHLSSSEGSNSLLRYMEQCFEEDNLVKKKKMDTFSKKKRSLADNINIPLGTFRYPIVTCNPHKSTSLGIESLSKRKNSVFIPKISDINCVDQLQEDSMKSHYELTNRCTQKSMPILDHLPPTSIQESIEDYSMSHSRSKDHHWNCHKSGPGTNFNGASDNSSMGTLSSSGEFTNNSMSPRFDYPSTVSLNAHRPKGDSERNPLKKFFEDTKEIAQYKSKSTNFKCREFPERFQEIPCTPPGMWSLQFSQPSEI